MAEMSKYCKAYYAKDFRKFDDWSENVDNLRPDVKEENREEVEVPRTELKEDDILYLHDNYTVTDGVFNDEHIIFDKVTDVWKSFCTETLEFEIPEYEPIEIPTADEASGEGAEAGA